MKTRNARNTALKLSALGIYAGICAIAACSSDPSAPSIGNHAGATGAGAPGAGAPGAGAPGAGAPGAGAPAGGDTSAGAPGAGAPAGGAPGAGSGGDTTAGAPGAGTGGAFVPPKPFCAPDATPVQTRAPLPFETTTSFIGAGYQGSPTAIKFTDCAAGERGPGAIGQCAKWAVSVPTDGAVYVGVAYQRNFEPSKPGGYIHPPVCIADGVTFVNFYAKGAVGGEKVTFTAEGAAEIEFTLTNAWKLYQIPMAGVVYNTDVDGVDMGFFWKVVAPTGGTVPATSFAVDSIQWVNTGVGVGVGGGGAGGAGGAGAGGTGGGGTGGGGAGGTAGT